MNDQADQRSLHHPPSPAEALVAAVSRSGDDPASTLRVEKEGSTAKRALTLGGEPGRWTVTHGDQIVATARMPLTRFEMPMELRTRRLTFRMPGMVNVLDPPKEFTVSDDSSGETVLSGTRIHGGRDLNLVCEEWAVAGPGRDPLTFVYRLREPRLLGYRDDNGTMLLSLGHDPRMDTAGGGWVRILFRFWKATAQSLDRYLVNLHEGTPDAPMLALVAVWLERTAEGRYPSASSG